jgi:glycosyltransferase involved in cell wall biosynthesis
MGQACLIVANDTPENAETLGGAGLLYGKNDRDDLARRLQETVDQPEAYAGLREAALDRARSVYSWENVIDQYEQLFLRMVKQ